MKTTKKLRLLSLLGFLLLMAPFYDACDGKSFFKKVPENNLVTNKSFQEKAYDVIVNEDALSAIELSTPMVTSPLKETKSELKEVFSKKDWYANLFVLISFLFCLIVLISFLLLILSFTKKQKLFVGLALTNCILVFITLVYIIFLESSFEHFRQIKWGYYAFIITNVFIFYYSKLALKRQNL
jgi:hypothetical protein